MIKKRLSLFLAGVMLLMLLPAPVMAADVNENGVPDEVSISSVLGMPVENVRVQSVSDSVYHISADVAVYYIEDSVSKEDISTTVSEPDVTICSNDDFSGDAGSVNLKAGGNADVFVKVVSTNPAITAEYTLSVSATAKKEITGFEPVSIYAGTAGSVAYYIDADTVINYLNEHHSSVEVQTGEGDTVSAPVTGWRDTDTYDPNTAGSYTFTAALEDNPGYTPGDGVTATAEVTVHDLSDEPVTINDSRLKLAICAALRVDSNHAVTAGDMESLTELDASDWGITDMTGLWTAVNLEVLDISGNPLTANVTGSTAYDNVLNGIEALTKLKTLDLSGCGLGINPASAGNTSIPTSLYFQGVNYLESLEELDLSNNRLKGQFAFIIPNTKLGNLKELDLSDNELNSIILRKAYHPYLESIDISGNYLYFDESQDFYQYMVDMGMEKFICNDMRNLADLFSVRVYNAGQSTDYYPENGQYAVNAGDILGDSLEVSCNTFSTGGAVKVTVNGEKYTAGSFTTSGDAIPLSGLELGWEYTVTFENMHLNEDTDTYTLTFTTKALPSSDSADSAGITDASLQAAVCSKLGKNPSTYVVTKNDMAGLTGSLQVYHLTNAEGIQYATGLSSSLYLYGSFSSLPDLSGLTNITQLRISSPNLTEISNLSSLKKVTAFYIADAGSLVSLPDVTGMEKLKTIDISGGSGLALPRGLSGCGSFTTLNVTDSTGFDFTGLENNTSMTVLAIKSTKGFVLPSAPSKLKTLRITDCELSQLPDAVTGMTNLTILGLSGNNLRELPDLSALGSLGTLDLSHNAFKDVPQAVTGLTWLKTLDMSYNPMPVVGAELSGMTGLESLNFTSCGLTVFPESLLTMETTSLKTLTVTQNNLRSINGSMANLDKLTTLNLQYNDLSVFPKGIMDLPALQVLYIYGNLYTDLPSGLAEALGDTLKLIAYGGRIKTSATFDSPAEDTNAYREAGVLKEKSIAASMNQSSAGVLYSELRTLDTSVGEITRIHEAIDPSAVQEYTLPMDSGSDSIILTPKAIWDDTTVTVNGTAVENGGSVEISLAEGLNSVSIVCHNEYTPSFAGSSYSNTTTYHLTIIVGSSTGSEFPAEDKTYSIGLRLKRQHEDVYSMADSYFSHNATMTYDAARKAFVIDVTVTRHSWITEMDYMDTSGNYVSAERISTDATANMAVYRIYVNNLESDLYISPWVVPMGYAPICRIIFDTDTIVDITGGGGEEPGFIHDGEYTMPVRLWNAVDNVASMGDAALTKTAELVVEDGHGTIYLKFSSLTVEALGMTGYLANLKLATNIQFNDLGGIESADLTDATVISSYDGIWDSFNHPDTGTDENVRGNAYPKKVSIPVELEEEYTYVQVYIPVMEALSAGSGTKFARVKLDWSGLTAAGEPNPDTEPAQEIGDNDGDGAVELTQDTLSGLSGTDNVGLSIGGVTLSIPVRYLNQIFAGNSGAAMQFKANETPEDTKAAVFRLLTGDNEVTGAVDLNLTLDGQNITALGGRVKISISLTDKQAKSLRNADSRKLCYFNPDNNTLTDMNATFDLTAKTVTFYTDHLSTYAIISTTSDKTGSGGSGGLTGGTRAGNSHGIENGTYSIEVDALQEYSNDRSMADQFFVEPAELSVSGETITVTTVMYGTSSISKLPDSIRMSYINSLQYRNSSGSWVNAVSSRNEGEDSLRIRMTVNSLDDVYMRVQTDYMGPDYKVFRLVFNGSSLKSGSVDFGSGVIPSAAADDYTIEATAGTGGSISPAGDVDVGKGEDQTFTITVNAGYAIKDVLVDGKSVGAVDTYTFRGVVDDHTISVTFEEAGVPVFDDTVSHWAKDAIDFVVEKGLFNGTSQITFSPDNSMTRGMFVTVLGRMHGADISKYKTVSFTDVDTSQYYAPYVAWAAENKIVSGIGSNRFAPGNTVTREQAAAMLANYRAFAEIDGNNKETFESLEDGRYTIEAKALMEAKDEPSMADQFLTEKAVLTVENGKIKAGMTWYGTEYITMDMIKELKYQKADGSFAEVDRVLSADNKSVTLSFDVVYIGEAVIFQVYVPEGMGESRTKFRLLFDPDTLAQMAAGFADDAKISSWAKDGVFAMQLAGLFKGDNNGNFNPRNPITRAEAAMIFARSLGFKG